MSRGNGSSVIPVAVFLALFLIVLPVSAENVTETITVNITQTVNATPQITETTTQTTNVTPQATVTTTPTANATTQTTATPLKTTVAVTRPTTIITTVNPTISVQETAKTGSVLVYSSPTGATILIDGVYAGTTPGNLNGVPAGNHILRLTLSGYYDYEGSIYVVPGQTAQGYGTLQPVSQVISVAPTPVPTVIIPVIVPVATTATKDAGLLGNSTVLTAIIGAIAVLIGSAATIFTHIRPPKKE